MKVSTGPTVHPARRQPRDLVLIEYWVVQITAGRRAARAAACPSGGDKTRQSPGCGDLALDSTRMTEVDRRVAGEAVRAVSADPVKVRGQRTSGSRPAR